MKVAVLIARILLGLMFVVFGLNIFFHFMPAPHPSKDLAGQFGTVLFASHYILFVGVLQVVGGALLLIGRYIPLGLTLLGPVIVNILLFHLLMAPASIIPGLVVTALWLVVFFSVRSAFAGIFAAKA